MAKTDKKTLEALASKHKVKKIYAIELTDEDGNEDEVLLKPLDRRAFGILSSLMSTDPVGAIEGVVGMLCVSENKEAILSDDSTLMSLATPIAEMMNTKTASLKKN
jgi:hypothetical protein